MRKVASPSARPERSEWPTWPASLRSATRRRVLALGAGGTALAALAGGRLARAEDLAAILGPLPATPEKGVLVWDPSEEGYVAEEFLLRGWADVTETVTMADAIDMSARDNVLDLGRRNFPLTLLDPQVRYVTRLIVYRPLEPTRFSGRTIIEPIHPLGGGESPVWASLNAFFMARGDALVAVQHPVTFAGLKAADPARYRALDAAHPSLLWGMLADAGRLAKEQILMPTLNVRRVYMTGYSFTGVATATFANYHHERTRLKSLAPVFDGYLSMANACFVRPIDAPVIRLNTQSDFAEFGGLANRAPDSDARIGRFRLYELAGAAHFVTPWPTRHAARAPRAGPALPPAPGQPHFDAAACAAGFPEGSTANDFPTRIAQAGAFASLCAWAETDAIPPRAPRILVDKAGRTKLDAHGNALGGLRFPQVSAPVATYAVGEGSAPLCGLFGYKRVWSAAELRALYPSAEAYVAAVRAQTSALVRQRFITPEGGAELLAEAQTIAF
jgi:hypothetical protein